jgi:hypothetical protein
MRNGIIKVYPEANKSVRLASFQGLTEMQAATLADEEGVEFVGASWEVQEDGTPLFYLEVKYVSDDIKIRVEAVAPEEFSVVGWHKLARRPTGSCLLNRLLKNSIYDAR